MIWALLVPREEADERKQELVRALLAEVLMIVNALLVIMPWSFFSLSISILTLI